MEYRQAHEGLKAWNKLTERHISWTKQKNEIAQTAQTLDVHQFSVLADIAWIGKEFHVLTTVLEWNYVNEIT